MPDEKLDKARRRAEGLLRSIGATITLDGVLDLVEVALRRCGGSTSAEAFASMRVTGGRPMLDALVAVAEPLGLFHVEGDRLVLGPPQAEPEPVTRHPSTRVPRPEETEVQRRAAEEMDRWLAFHLYGRVSTEEQAYGDSLDAQRAAAHALAPRFGLRIVAKTVEVRRAPDRRPLLEAVLAAVEAREVAGLLVTRLDRLRRSVAQLGYILARFDTVGGAIVALEDGADSRTAEGRVRLRALAAEAQRESERCSERIRASMRYRQARGLTTNGAPPLRLGARR